MFGFIIRWYRQISLCMMNCFPLTELALQDNLRAQQKRTVTQRYEYVATLDARTSAICRSLDGKIFKTKESFSSLKGFKICSQV